MMIPRRFSNGKNIHSRFCMLSRVNSAREDITDCPEEGLARVQKAVTMVLQEGALFGSLTLAENVSFPIRERGGLSESIYVGNCPDFAVQATICACSLLDVTFVTITLKSKVR